MDDDLIKNAADPLHPLSIADAAKELGISRSAMSRRIQKVELNSYNEKIKECKVAEEKRRKLVVKLAIKSKKKAVCTSTPAPGASKRPLNLTTSISPVFKPRKYASLPKKPYINVGDVSTEYSCEKCDFATKTKKSLTEHKTRNHSVRRCEPCGLEFDNYYKYKGHILRVPHNFRYKCELCAKTCRNKDGLNKHIRSIHNKSTEQTIISAAKKRTTPSKISTATSAIKRSPGGKARFQCQKCLYVGGNDKLLKMHCIRQHTFARCEPCGLGFTSRTQYEWHTRTVQHDFQFKCPSCTRSFQTEKSVRQHARVTHGEDYVCSTTSNDTTPKKCPSNSGSGRITRDSAQKRNSVSHNEESLFNGSQFQSSSSNALISQERLTDDPERSLAVFTCNQCDFDNSDPVVVRQHKQQEHNMPVKELSCDMCGLHFTHYSQLTVHMKNHALNYKCNLCSNKFSTASLLEGHMQSVHAKQRKSVEKRTIVQANACQICHSRFRIRRNLLRHLRGVHNAQIYQCPICCNHRGGRSMQLLQTDEGFVEHMVVEHAFAQTDASKYAPQCIIKMNDVSPGGCTCKQCGKVCRTRPGLSRHMHICYRTKTKYHCKICRKRCKASVFQTQDEYDEHVKLKHAKLLETNQIEISEKRTDVASTKDCSPSKLVSYVCPHCSKEYSSSNGMYRHIRYVHRRPVYNCHLCDRGGALYVTEDEFCNHLLSAHKFTYELVKEYLQRETEKMNASVCSSVDDQVSVTDDPTNDDSHQLHAEALDQMLNPVVNLGVEKDAVDKFVAESVRGEENALLDAASTSTGPGQELDTNLDGLNMEQSTVDKYVVDSTETIDWEVVVGLSGAKELLVESIIDNFAGSCKQSKRSVLLFGPTGNGKTMLVKSLAKHADYPLYDVTSAMKSKESMSQAFADLKKKQPVIVLIEAVESSGNDNLLADLLHEIEIIQTESEQLLILVTSNEPWRMDENFRKRFSQKIFVEFPNKKARRALFRKFMETYKNTLVDEDYKTIGRSTKHYIALDLANLARKASFMRHREIGVKNRKNIEAELRPVTMADVEQVLETVKPSCDENYRENFKEICSEIV